MEALADVSYANLFLAGRGYKPVGDVRAETPSVICFPDGNRIPDNPLYWDWCRAESPAIDYWQTSGKTRQSKKGDCEDIPLKLGF